MGLTVAITQAIFTAWLFLFPRKSIFRSRAASTGKRAMVARSLGRGFYLRGITENGRGTLENKKVPFPIRPPRDAALLFRDLHRTTMRRYESLSYAALSRARMRLVRVHTTHVPISDIHLFPPLSLCRRTRHRRIVIFAIIL